jgi:hypothetical protein
MPHFEVSRMEKVQDTYENQNNIKMSTMLNIGKLIIEYFQSKLILYSLISHVWWAHNKFN